MKIKIFLAVIIIGLAAGLVWAAKHQTELLEKALNGAAREYFENSIRLKSASFDPKLKLRLKGLTGNFKTPEGPYPVEISSLNSVNSPINLLLQKEAVFAFDGVRLNRSAFKGINGQFIAGPGSFRLESQVEGLGLEDIAPLNPANLQGAKGELLGKISLEVKTGKEPVFEAELQGTKAGGKVPSRFFAAFLPYLPQVQNRRQLEAIIQIAGVVSFDEADFKISSVGPGRMKVFLHMRIPDYNFNLNLNMEIRADEENFFRELPKLMENFKAS